MGRYLRPRLTLESFTDDEMSPDELWTLRRERLRAFDQIEWLPGVAVARRQQQGRCGQVAWCCVCNEDSGLSILLGSKGVGICAASSRIRTRGEREHAEQCDGISQSARPHIKLPETAITRL